MAVWQFNRGEWTEAYVFLRLLGDGRIYGADTDLKKNTDVFLDIESILRFEESSILKFQRSLDGLYVDAYDDKCKFVVVTTKELSEKAAILYSSIISVTGGDRRLDIPLIQSYLETLHFSSPKAKTPPPLYQEKYGEKSDIVFSYRLSADGSSNTEGFSIKSYLGSKPTLFNAAEASRFIYQLNGCNDQKMHEINSKDSTLDMCNAINEDPDITLRFAPEKMNENFAVNLEKVDSRMIEIIEAALRIQCGLLERADSPNISDIVNKLSQLNPLNNRDPKNFYTAKFKDFLFASFAGLTASTLWNGRKKLTGGYIEVDKSGEMLYYRAMSDDVFSTYLFNNTKIDRPDRGVLCDIAVAEGKCYMEGKTLSIIDRRNIMLNSKGKPRGKRCNYGYVYKEGGNYYFSLNFQARFK
ncbi:MAG: HpaII family restriction endonuclease [Paludibacteraceae bacterium]|nr:HpaII family restriction endonuclease [Paludibacteraceae bacterium]